MRYLGKDSKQRHDLDGIIKEEKRIKRDLRPKSSGTPNICRTEEDESAKDFSFVKEENPRTRRMIKIIVS